MFVVVHFGTGNEMKIYGTFDNAETAKEFMIKDVFRNKNVLKDAFKDNITISSTHFGPDNCGCCLKYHIDMLGEQEENWGVEEILKVPTKTT